MLRRLLSEVLVKAEPIEKMLGLPSVERQVARVTKAADVSKVDALEEVLGGIERDLVVSPRALRT
jgi:hypothetical protein